MTREQWSAGAGMWSPPTAPRQWVGRSVVNGSSLYLYLWTRRTARHKRGGLSRLPSQSPLQWPRLKAHICAGTDFSLVFLNLTLILRWIYTIEKSYTATRLNGHTHPIYLYSCLILFYTTQVVSLSPFITVFIWLYGIYVKIEQLYSSHFAPRCRHK